MNEQPNLLTPNYNQQANLSNATPSLVLGIVSIVGAFCYGIGGVICGIIGLILANKDRKLYQANPEMYTASSYSTLNAGRVCSLIGLIMGALFMIATLLFFVFFGGTMMEAMRQGRTQ